MLSTAPSSQQYTEYFNLKVKVDQPSRSSQQIDNFTEHTKLCYDGENCNQRNKLSVSWDKMPSSES